ncbi:MAG: hypothetical protein ISR91_01325, partial [Candidatus Delongbacteria bacterium]|nr:hypothetical protein [Candidatus Delongbacteria bacterium]
PKRVSALLIIWCATFSGAAGVLLEPTTSPVHDDLLQMSLRSGQRLPGAFYNFSTRDRIVTYLQVGLCGSEASREQRRRQFLLNYLREDTRRRSLAIVPHDRTLPRLYPLWSGCVATDGDSTFLELTNGFSFAWEPALQVGLKLHFQDATVRGSRELFESPAWLPGDNLAWEAAGDGDLFFHDELEGGLLYSGEQFSALIGRDYLRLGHDQRLSTLTGTGTPSVNQLLFHYTGNGFEAAYLLAELHSNLSVTTTPADWGGKPHTVPLDKYLVYHRLAWQGERFACGFSDMVIFSEQPLRLGYLNPISFFWSEEHYGGDNDNSLLVLDFSLLHPGWELWSELLFDDLTFSRLFSSKPVNKTAIAAGWRIAPADGLLLSGGAAFTRPFVYTHFHATDDFRHQGRTLSSLQPNSLKYSLACRWLLTAAQHLEADWDWTVQGVGYWEEGVYHNVGSSFEHTIFDGDANFPFLAGRKQYTQRAALSWYLYGSPTLPFWNRQLEWLQLEMTFSQYRAALALDPAGTPNRHREVFNALWLKLTLDHDLH